MEWYRIDILFCSTYSISVDKQIETSYHFDVIVNGRSVGNMQRQDIINSLEAIARQHNGMIRTKAAENGGVSRAMLSKLYNEGLLSRLAVGQYVFAAELGDDMMSLGRRSNFIVFSHESALFLNGLSERTPFVHAVTIPSSSTLIASLREQCKVYYVKDALHGMGKAMLKTTMGNLVPAYGPERTVCDVIRSRSRVAEETLLPALKMYAASPGKDLVKLSIYAEAFGVTSVVRSYLRGLV
jgi:predicted transcriptional regulator of viral defense system